MDEIWDGKVGGHSLAVVAGTNKPKDHAEINGKKREKKAVISCRHLLN